MQQARDYLHDLNVRHRASIVELLKDTCHWTTASDIERWTGISPSRVRELCQIFPCLLISRSQGYKLANNATASEVRECVQSLLHRSEKIMARASALTEMI